MREPQTLSFFKRPHSKPRPGARETTKWGTTLDRAHSKRPDESGVLPVICEREPVAACAGLFSGLPPIPRSLASQGKFIDLPVHDGSRLGQPPNAGRHLEKGLPDEY